MAKQLHPSLDRDKALVALSKELASLESRVRPRTLTDQQSLLVSSALRKAKPIPVEIYCVMGGSEGFAYAEQFRAALAQSGWPVGKVTQSSFDQPVIGLKIAVGRKAPD